MRGKLLHPCEWCGTRQRPGFQTCEPGCDRKKDRHAEGRAVRCPRGPQCARDVAFWASTG